MSEYGITPTGVNIKRLDTIMDELHTDLSEGWGVNTRLNPKSNLNVLITNFSDKLAELWEFGKGIYDAMYPSSAEGINLDNACQFGEQSGKLPPVPTTRSTVPAWTALHWTRPPSLHRPPIRKSGLCCWALRPSPAVPSTERRLRSCP